MTWNILVLILLAAPAKAQWSSSDYTTGKAVSVPTSGISLATVAANGANADITSMSAMRTISSALTHTSSATFQATTVGVSSAATSAFALCLDAAYTTAQLQAKTPAKVGCLVYNTTLNNVCVSTGAATAQAYKLIGTASTSCQ